MLDKAKQVIDLLGSVPSHLHALMLILTGATIAVIPAHGFTHAYEMGASLVSAGLAIYRAP